MPRTTPDPSPWLRALARAGAVLALWTVFGLLWAASPLVEMAAPGNYRGRAHHIVPFYWAWAALTPAVVLAARWATRRVGHGARRWALLLAACPAVVVAHGVLYLLLLRALGVVPWVRVDGSAVADYVARHGGGDVATYLALVGVWLLVDAERRARDREVRAAALEARLARADLELLRWRLQPHFLFNALNALSTMVLRGDGAAATRAIELMARYLRGALRQEADARVPLADELDGVRRYLDIEALRFGAALRVETRVADDALAARVPGAILQPLVENAVRHAPGVRDGRGAIVIAAARGGGRVRLTVADPGGAPPGSGPNGAADAGFGLRYVRERLRLCYGDAATFDLAVAPAGTVATVDLPDEGGA